MDEFQSVRLDTGLEIIGQRLPGVRTAALAFFIGHGAVDDVPQFGGLAHLTESTMFRGTAHRDSREISDEFDRLGASRSSSTGLEASLFRGVMLGDRLKPALGVFLDVLRFASFPQVELEAVRALHLQEIGQRNDQPAQLVMDRARQLYFAGHPLGHDALGSEDSVAGLTRDQVVDDWNRWYRSGPVILAVAGSFVWDDVVEHVRGATADWKLEGHRRTSTEPALNPAVAVHRTAVAQENLCFTFPGVSYSDADYYAAALAASVLGGGMNSRLFMEVREKRGLAYSVGARSDAMSSTGLVRVYVGTQPERAAESVEVIHAELDLLTRKGITDDELRLAQTRLKSRVIMNSESTGNRVMAIGRDWFYERRFRSLSDIGKAIDAVTVEDVGRHLRQINLMDNLGMVAVGPVTASDLGLDSRAVEFGAPVPEGVA